MNIDEIINSDAFILAIASISALIFGLILQKVIIPRLRKRSARNRAVNSRILLKNVQDVIMIWVVLGTFYGIGRYLQIETTSIIGRLMSASLIVLIISVIYMLNQVNNNLIRYYIRKEKLPNTTIFSSLSSLLIIIIGLMLVFASIGFSITPIVAAFGIGGLAVALALQPTLANLFAGISIIASKQINPGDFVELSINQSGHIDDIQWRTTSIRTIQNNLIIIPNSVISNMIVTNYSLPQKELMLSIPVGVHYDADLDHVRDVCFDVAKKLQETEEGAVRDFEPRIRFKQFGPSSIDLNIVLQIHEFTQQHHIRSEFIRQLRKRFKEEGIIIPYPITTVEFGGNRTPFSDKGNYS